MLGSVETKVASAYWGGWRKKTKKEEGATMGRGRKRDPG